MEKKILELKLILFPLQAAIEHGALPSRLLIKGKRTKEFCYKSNCLYLYLMSNQLREVQCIEYLFRG